MYKNDSMSVKAKTLAHEICHRIYCRQQSYHDVTEISPLFVANLSREKKMTDFGACRMQEETTDEVVVELSEPQMKIDDIHHTNNDIVNENIDEFAINPWKDSISKGAVYWLRWPIDLLLFSSVPDPRRHKSHFMVTFISCIIWIGICSYLIVYVTTDVGM
jgi:hypothetical protein